MTFVDIIDIMFSINIGGVSMENCPKCKSKLNIDEKSSGKCFSCGATFEYLLPKESKQFNYNSYENTVAKLIKVCGFAIIILGTIGSIVIANKNFDSSYRSYEFSPIRFLIPELFSVMNGLLFIGFSAIIQLLEDIKNKLK